MRSKRAFAFIALGCIFVAGSARAADPTTSDCLASSEKTLQLRGERKLRDARAQAATCAWATCPTDVRDECNKRVAEINAAIPTIVFEVRDAAGNDLTAVRVTFGGELLAAKLDGTAISLDPGEHKFVFEAGTQRLEKTIVVREGEKLRRERIVFPPAPILSAPTPAPTASQTPANVPADVQAPAVAGSTQRTIGLVVGAFGVASLGLGTVFGLNASSKWSSAKDACTATSCVNRAQAQSDHDSAQSAATVSTIAVVVGTAAVGAGLVLFLTAPKGAAAPQGLVVAPSVAPGTGGLVMRGTF